MLVRIARARARGTSYDAIAARLNTDRIRTKRGGRWCAMTVRSVLRTAARREEHAGSPVRETPRARR